MMVNKYTDPNSFKYVGSKCKKEYIFIPTRDWLNVYRKLKKNQFPISKLGNVTLKNLQKCSKLNRTR